MVYIIKNSTVIYTLLFLICTKHLQKEKKADLFYDFKDHHGVRNMMIDALDTNVMGEKLS